PASAFPAAARPPHGGASRSNSAAARQRSAPHPTAARGCARPTSRGCRLQLEQPVQVQLGQRRVTVAVVALRPLARRRGPRLVGLRPTPRRAAPRRGGVPLSGGGRDVVAILLAVP